MLFTVELKPFVTSHITITICECVPEGNLVKSFVLVSRVYREILFYKGFATPPENAGLFLTGQNT